MPELLRRPKDRLHWGGANSLSSLGGRRGPGRGGPLCSRFTCPLAISSSTGSRGALHTLHAAVPIPIHLLRGRNFQRPNNSETDKVRLIQIPHTFWQSRVRIPLALRTAPGGAAQLRGLPKLPIRRQ